MDETDARHDARFYVHTFQFISANDPYGSVSPHRVAASIADKTYEIGLVTRQRVGCFFKKKGGKRGQKGAKKGQKLTDDRKNADPRVISTML